MKPFDFEMCQTCSKWQPDLEMAFHKKQCRPMLTRRSMQGGDSRMNNMNDSSFFKRLKPDEDEIAKAREALAHDHKYIMSADTRAWLQETVQHSGIQV